MRNARIRAWLGLCGLALATQACSYGAVSDGSTGAFLGGAVVKFRAPDLRGSSVSTDVYPTLGSSFSVATWSASDELSNGAQGAYYLNPFGSFAASDSHSRNVQVPSGWLRIAVARTGYRSRIFYRNHLYTLCPVPANQGPYSAGRYRYVDPQEPPFIDGACAMQNFQLFRGVHELLPDLIVDVRGLRQSHVSDECDDDNDDDTDVGLCLRVSVATANVGNAHLVLTGSSRTPGVYQKRYMSDGSTPAAQLLPGAAFEYDGHEDHDHFHLRNWTSMRLRQVTSSCSTEATATNCPLLPEENHGRKLSFCLQDSNVFDSSLKLQEGGAVTCQYNASTGAITQHIHAGWADLYDFATEGQMIPIDGLSGDYWLEVEVNPVNANGSRTVVEGDSSNNITRLKVRL